VFTELSSKRPTVGTNAVLYQSGGIELEHYAHSVDCACIQTNFPKGGSMRDQPYTQAISARRNRPEQDSAARVGNR
jgi:hypothetical protein